MYHHIRETTALHHVRIISTSPCQQYTFTAASCSIQWLEVVLPMKDQSAFGRSSTTLGRIGRIGFSEVER